MWLASGWGEGVWCGRAVRAVCGVVCGLNLWSAGACGGPSHIPAAMYSTVRTLGQADVDDAQATAGAEKQSLQNASVPVGVNALSRA
jgi:hypothetical protein